MDMAWTREKGFVLGREDGLTCWPMLTPLGCTNGVWHPGWRGAHVVCRSRVGKNKILSWCTTWMDGMRRDFQRLRGPHPGTVGRVSWRLPMKIH